MEFPVVKMVDKFLREKKIKHRWLAIFLCLALVVALTTTAALKLTGIAKTRKLTVLNCPVEIHEHVDSCYDGEKNLICGEADFVVHTHSLDCYYDDELTCTLPEIESHEHTEDCYTQEKDLVCDQTESEESDDEGHVHTDECYEVRETLICEKEEIILHTHTVDCFKEAVFDENGIMVSLTSKLPEDVTVPDSWTRDMVPACGKLQIEEHIHGAGCLDTIKLTPEEAEEFTPEEAKAYVVNMAANGKRAVSNDNDVSDNWSGTNEGKDRKDISSDDGTKTVQEQITWSMTINFPNDETWTDFTYTDSFRQTMTGWILQENGEKTWEEDHSIHHYQVLKRLNKELNGALKSCLEQAGLENDFTYTFVYKDKDGNEVTDNNAEVVYFEIHFQREAGQNLYGQSISFDYTSLVDTVDFADNTDYNIYNDFTLPDFTGAGNFYFQYTDRISNASETGDISVKKVWLDVRGNTLTDGIPDQVEMVLKQYAFKGGIYLTEKPENSENWCKITLNIDQGEAEEQHDVKIKALNKELLGTNTAKVWVPRNSKIQLNADYENPDSSADETSSDDSWSYAFNVKNESSCELNISVDDGYNNIFLSVIGKAPAGFIPSGDFAQYGKTITLNGVDDDWSHTWKQLPLDDGNDTQYVYIVEEVEVPDGYYATVADDGEGTFTVTNRKSMEPGKITVEKKWVDNEGYPLVTHPNSVEVELQKKVPNSSSANTDSENGSEDDEWVTVENSSITLPNEEGEWTASWTELEDGEYRVVEKPVEGYAVSYIYTSYDNKGNSYSNPESLSENAGFVTIINIESLAEDGDIVVVKVWEYEDGTPDTDHPDSVRVTIKRAKRSSDDSDTPSDSEPDTSEPSTSKPDTSEPSTSGSDTSQPSTSEIDSSESDTSDSDSSEKDSSELDSSDSVSSGTGTPKSNRRSGFFKNPFTGDETNLIPYIIVALISGILALAFALYGFKHRKRQKGKAIEEDEDE